MEINFSGLITKKEFVNAIKIHYNQQLKRTKLFFGIILVIFACSILSTVFLLISENTTIQKPYLIPLMLIPLILLTYPWWIPLLSGRSYDKKENGYNGPIHGSINDQGITIFTKLANANLYWSAYSSYILKDNLLLLYQSKNCFNIFTRSLFTSDEDWQKSIIFISQKLPVKKAGLFS
jgi:hypothetical protein